MCRGDAIKKYVDSNKGKQATFKYNALMEEFRHQSDIVSNDKFVFKPFRSNACLSLEGTKIDQSCLKGLSLKAFG